ncbi:MAG: hypothetical protein KDI54_18770, partial [Gammaproteobacteria bacterium]|nr:hypothetical protein [Gammaproteobacteria bacterium]
ALVNRQQNSYLASDAVDDDPMNPLLEHALTYRITVGPQVGRKVFILQMLPACDPEDQFGEYRGQGGRFQPSLTGVIVVILPILLIKRRKSDTFHCQLIYLGMYYFCSSLRCEFHSLISIVSQVDARSTSRISGTFPD